MVGVVARVTTPLVEEGLAADEDSPQTDNESADHHADTVREIRLDMSIDLKRRVVKGKGGEVEGGTETYMLALTPATIPMNTGKRM